jgi:two-component system sensor histidine kinase/response regulator
VSADATVPAGSDLHHAGQADVTSESLGSLAAATTCDRAATRARGRRVLLVEDNAVNQKLAVRLLETQGHTVTLAVDGKLAVKAMEREEFDVVLMDVQMPEMDGLEATATIRAKERDNGRHVPIIAMTAHAMQGDRERCLAAGMDGYISKPVDSRELMETIEAVRSTLGRSERQ